MSVNGVSGATSLPMALPGPPPAGSPPVGRPPAGPPSATGAPGAGNEVGPRATGAASDAAGSAAASPAASTSTEAAAKHKEPPKPPPLPPLRGLTVAEVRAMLGVGPMPGQNENTTASITTVTSITAAPQGSTSIISAALHRYA